MTKFDVITVGSATLDVFVDSEGYGNKKAISFPVGSKILIDELRFSIGGGGTNSAVCFSKLGVKTGFLGKIGSGHNSGIILRELRKAGVEFLGARGDDRTGYSVVLGSKDNNRTILTYKGVNDTLNIKELKLNRCKTKAFYFSSMMGASFEAQLKIAEYATSKGIPFAYNPSTYQVKQGLKKIKPLISEAEILILNDEEAGILSGNKDPLEFLKSIGPEIVCITRGSKGAMAFDGKFKYKVFAHKVKCVEATGAGDTFGSTFVFGALKGMTIEDSLKLAVLNSESVIGHPGAKNGLLSLKELEKNLKDRPVKLLRYI